MNRKDKTALLLSLMHGNPAPLVQHNEQNEVGTIQVIQARQSQGCDLVADVKLNGQPVADMARSGYGRWKEQVGAKGGLVICFIRRERGQ
jgi:hypothetical protein